jgi:hypothetical protein
MGSEALYIQKRPKIDHGRPGPQTASGAAGDAVLRESFDGHARWVALVDVADTGIPSDHKRAKVVAAAAEADADADADAAAAAAARDHTTGGADDHGYFEGLLNGTWIWGTIGTELSGWGTIQSRVDAGQRRAHLNDPTES